VQIDAYYAQAWALLSIAQSNLRYGFGQPVDDGFAAAHTALAIDPTIAEARCAMIRRFEEKGLSEKVSAELEMALRLGPDSWEVNKEAARVYLRQGRVGDAARHFEKAASIMESDVHAWGMLLSCYHALGDKAAERKAAEMSIAQAEKVLAQDPSNGAAMSFGATGHAALGQADRATEWMNRAMLIDPDNNNMRYNFACMLAVYFRDTEGALTLLERSFATVGGNQIRLAEKDPDLDSLRDDPKFQKMFARARKRLGIEDAPAPSSPAPATPAAT
jgi:adenylate cyclase